MADPESGSLETGRIPLPLMGWEEVRELRTWGWEIGGHTRSHPHLDTLDRAEAFTEILQGKRETEEQIGEALRTFCYPFGHWNAHTPALVQRAGFAGACTVRSGLAGAECDPYLMPRIKVGYRDGVTGLLYRLLVRPNLPTFRRRRRSHLTAAPVYEEV
jgi:peptidoglycan/xylan/chitin deacetylase (PgdA/CDA1 family)